MTSLISKIETAFSDFWSQWAEPKVEQVEEIVEEFFTEAEHAVVDELGVVGLKIVTDGVTAAEASGGTGAEKLAAATSAITADLSKAAITGYATTTLNVAIQGAVAKLKTVAAPAAQS